MDTPEDLSEIILKYRLDELDSEERERIDALLISDAEFHAAFRDGEYDLLDAYAANELAEPDRERVGNAFHPYSAGTFGLPDRFLETKPAIAPSERIAAAAGSKGKVVAMRSPGLWAVAALLVVAGGVELVVRSRMGVGNVGLSQPAIARATPPTVAPPPQVSSAEMSIVLLLGGGTRAQGATALQLPSGAKELRVEWVPSVSPQRNTQYELRIVSETGQSECNSRGLLDKSPGAHRVVEFVCPARDVPAGVSLFRVYAGAADENALPLTEVTVAVRK